MHISDIFQKLGIKGYDDLKTDEKKVYMAWEQVLHRPDVTMEDLKKILPAEIQKAEAELEKYDNSPQKDLFHKAHLKTLRLLASIITTPEKERAALEQQLRQKFKL